VEAVNVCQAELPELAEKAEKLELTSSKTHKRIRMQSKKQMAENLMAVMVVTRTVAMALKGR